MNLNLNIEIGQFRGEQYRDGIVGYDYARQVWVDTRPDAPRDAHYPLGSASNPLARIPG